MELSKKITEANALHLTDNYIMKRTLFALLILATLTSCNSTDLYEDVITNYENGNRKEVRYYQVNKDGSKTWVRETWYYMEGMKHLDGPIANDKRNGNFETYYKSGNLMSTGLFVDGIREGKAVVYYENGNIHYEGNYKNGKECGIWKFYREDGKLIEEINRDLR